MENFNLNAFSFISKYFKWYVAIAQKCDLLYVTMKVRISIKDILHVIPLMDFFIIQIYLLLLFWNFLNSTAVYYKLLQSLTTKYNVFCL